MEMMRGVGYLPEVPKAEDYTEDNPKVTELLRKTEVPNLREASRGGGRGTIAGGGSFAAAGTATAAVADQANG
jgi:hypothetical protein